MEMERGIKTPNITWVIVCFFKTTLDHPMNGVKRNKRRRSGVVGKIYIKVIKSIVEYVICPDIFQ